MDEVERNLRYLAKEVIPKFRQGRVNFESNRTAAKVEG
jgi:hypothetical protein